VHNNFGQAQEGKKIRGVLKPEMFGFFSKCSFLPSDTALGRFFVRRCWCPDSQFFPQK